MVYSTRRFVSCLTLCYFVLLFFSPFSIAITSLGEERANLSAFRTFVRFALVWFCLFPLPLGVWEGLRFVIVAFPGLFSYLFFICLLKNIDCGCSLEPPQRGGFKEYHNLCFEQKYEKYQNFSSENFHFLVVKFSIHLNRHVS